VKLTADCKDTSLLRNLSIFRKLPFQIFLLQAHGAEGVGGLLELNINLTFSSQTLYLCSTGASMIKKSFTKLPNVKINHFLMELDSAAENRIIVDSSHFKAATTPSITAFSLMTLGIMALEIMMLGKMCYRRKHV